MHVTRVELENIKAYERADYTFERGTTAIVGPNGAGKTTILESVAWALFDTLEYSKDEFLRRGAKKGTARVTFESDLDGRRYTVYRDTGQGYYVFDPELKVRLAEKKADVRSFLNQHLGIEPGTDLKALFRSAIGVPQGLFTTDFLRSPAERKTAFDRLLKVEEYRESAERLRDTINLIRERVAEARGRISGAEAQLARYDATVAEHAAAASRVAELDEALARLQRETEERARAVAELDEAERRVTETRARADRAEVELISAEQRLSDLRGQLEAAERASERQRVTEADWRAHLGALEALRALEAERAERDRLRAEAADTARRADAAAHHLRRLEEALERSVKAGSALVELEGEIAAQEELERERERLRDLQAQARAAGERLKRLDRELDLLRRQHAETRERLRAAEKLDGAQERADRLESERLGVETRLSKLEQDLTAKRHLAGQRRESAREAERLRRSVATLEREAGELERLAAVAASAAELETRERELMRQAAQLRAAIERDEKTREEIRGGVCPVLRERCTSFGEGQGHDAFFADLLKTNRARLASVEVEGARVVKSVRAAREAEKNAARFDATLARLAHERALLQEREAATARLDEQLAALAGASEELRDELQVELTGIGGVLIAAREDALRHAELEPLRARLSEVEDEGKRRREERDEVAAAASADESLTRDIKEVESRLRALKDPRGRAAGLREEAAREASLRAEAVEAREAHDALARQRDALDAQLGRFAELDAEWARAAAERERTAPAHREYLESKSLADTLPARASEAGQAAERAERAREAAAGARAEHERAVAAYDRERHGHERGRLELARVQFATLSAQAESAREAERRLGEEVARLDEVRGSLRDEFRQKERLEELEQATDFVRDILKAAGPLVTESYLYNISIEANAFFREITGEGGRALRWSKDYDIMLEEGGHERTFAVLSGGEQMAAALAVRLALLKQLSDIRVAFFDEPTVNMDVERRERLAQQLGQVRDFDQLFVISHDDTFEQTVDHVVPVRRAEAEETA